MFCRKYALHCIDFYQNNLKHCKFDLFFFKDKIVPQSDNIKMLSCRKPFGKACMCHQEITDEGTASGGRGGLLP